jgi:hypothetical protein
MIALQQACRLHEFATGAAAECFVRTSSSSSKRRRMKRKRRRRSTVSIVVKSSHSSSSGTYNSYLCMMRLL